MAPNHNFVDPERIEHGSPLRLPGHPVNGQPMDLEGWSGMQTEVHIQATVFILFGIITCLFGHSIEILKMQIGGGRCIFYLSILCILLWSCH